MSTMDIHGDNSPGAWDQLIIGPHDKSQSKNPPFSTPNGNAVPTFQRAASDWMGSTVYIGSESNQQQPIKIVDRQAGRDWVLLFVPSTAPAGVYVAPHDSQLESTPPLGFLIPLGGNITLPTEAAIWGVSAINGTDTLICVAVGTNIQ